MRICLIYPFANIFHHDIQLSRIITAHLLFQLVWNELRRKEAKRRINIQEKIIKP